LTIRPLPPVATPLNTYGVDGAGGYYGKIAYCQNDKAISLREFGLQPLPENVSIAYQKESGDLVFTGDPPVPNTDKTGTAVYTFRTYLDGCPSTLGYATRLIVTVNPRPEKPIAQTGAITVCQGQSVGPLSASATVANASLLWYGANRTAGSGSTTAPTPATQNPGTYKYYVTQKLNDCESEQVELTIIVNPIPAAPTVQAVAICANEAAPALQATGTNLRWYTAVSGGAGADVTPVVSTSQAGQTTYYVSQALNGCESPRAPLAVTVNAIPGMPVVSTAGPTYCQGAGAVSLVATGQGLNWYKESAGGTSLGSSVTPETGSPGNTTYYVSQRINGCEGGRSSLTVRVNASPATPTVNSTYTYCQKTTPASLTATGTALSWYGADGKRSDTAPTPSTDTPGTVSYYVTQTAEGCESQRAEIKVTTNATPAAPAVQAVAVCQNQAAPTLQAVGQGLLWYTVESGGTGTATVPTINTGQAGLTTFYVSQSTNGCEGPRASLAATVKALPPAPGVTQRNLCQFVPTEPVTATGTNLIWYNTDNNRFTSTPSVLTDKGATFTYLVTQTVDGCEGPKATLTVNVLTTPVPTVAKTTIEICQGAVVQPLEATGTNLRWTDPSGVTSTTAPVPSAVVATARPDGDVYYVTQIGTNTCESPRVAIRVFVQTVPTLTVSGTTTINLGQETPLKLAFTGVGPYQYRFSTGLLGTATKDTTILVLPERTTTYQVTDVTNKCGVGQSGSLASITVRVPTIQTLAMSSTTLCVGTNLTAAFQTTGDFNTGSVFRLQLAKTGTDTTKAAFIDLSNSTVASGQVTASIPTTLGAGTYWVRVMATNPKIPINGSISPTQLIIRPLPTAALTGTQSIYEGQSAKLSVAFTGDAPWTFSLQDSSSTGSGAVRSVQTAANPHTIDVSPTQSTAYVLRDVQNGCGLTKLTLTPVLVTVNKVLGVEDQALADAIDVYPVPAVTTLTVRLRGLSPAQTARIELISETGLAAWQTETRQETSVLSLDRQPAGVYVLRVRVGDRQASRRIVKR
jgi:hypothetical protein